MKKRTIMIFPEFENMKYIESLREKYDPLFNKVRPHITLVFPFESSYETRELKSILQQHLSTYKPFEINVQGLCAFDYWLFLKLTKGGDKIEEIHSKLYQNEFTECKPQWLHYYVPHITVGQFNTKEKLMAVYQNEGDFTNIFHCIANKISVEIIGENEESILEFEQALIP